mmetsp:Transcript_40028/g.101342  ORF Transcript_40028/g.101342 Transcript_40028/m.101342 type:complete len:325 (-) Transcript_40028:324-1298(-)
MNAMMAASAGNGITLHPPTGGLDSRDVVDGLDAVWGGRFATGAERTWSGATRGRGARPQLLPHPLPGGARARPQLIVARRPRRQRAAPQRQHHRQLHAQRHQLPQLLHHLVPRVRPAPQVLPHRLPVPRHDAHHPPAPPRGRQHRRQRRRPGTQQRLRGLLLSRTRTLAARGWWLERRRVRLDAVPPRGVHGVARLARAVLDAVHAAVAGAHAAVRRAAEGAAGRLLAGRRADAGGGVDEARATRRVQHVPRLAGAIAEVVHARAARLDAAVAGAKKGAAPVGPRRVLLAPAHPAGRGLRSAAGLRPVSNRLRTASLGACYGCR